FAPDDPTDRSGAEPAVGRRPATPWLSRPLLDLPGADATGGPGARTSSRARLGLVGLAATVLPTIGVMAAVRGGDEPVAAGADPALPEIVAVTSTVDRPTTVPTDAGGPTPTDAGSPDPEASTTSAPGTAGSDVPTTGASATGVPTTGAPAASSSSQPAPSSPGATRQATTTTLGPSSGTTPQAVAAQLPPDLTQAQVAYWDSATADEKAFLERRRTASYTASASGCYGAYGFSQATWDRLAGKLGW